jgi:hypothetical protein
MHVKRVAQRVPFNIQLGPAATLLLEYFLPGDTSREMVCLGGTYTWCWLDLKVCVASLVDCLRSGAARIRTQ